MKKSILVTGASGYVGRHVVREAIQQGLHVIAADVVRRELAGDTEFIEGDILNDQAYVDSLPIPDVLVHLAWQDGFKHNSPTHLANLSGHYNFIRRMVARGCSHVVVMGTMHEVGYHEGAILDATPCNPLSMYGIAKNALREALFVEFSNQPICFQWLRGYYLYGDDNFNHSIFSKILQAAEKGQKKFPFTSGKNKYDFTPIQKLANMIVSASMQTQITGIINCCTGEPKSLGEVVEKFIADNGLSIELEYGAFPDRPYDSPGVWGDPTKINQILALVKANAN